MLKNWKSCSKMLKTVGGTPPACRGAPPPRVRGCLETPSWTFGSVQVSPHHLHSHTSPPARMPVPPSPIQMRPPLAARGWNTNALAAFFDRIRELNATRIKGRSLSCTATSYKFTSMAMNSAYASAAVAAVVDALGALGWPQGSR